MSPLRNSILVAVLTVGAPLHAQFHPEDRAIAEEHRVYMSKTLKGPVSFGQFPDTLVDLTADDWGRNEEIEAFQDHARARSGRLAFILYATNSLGRIDVAYPIHLAHDPQGFRILARMPYLSTIGLNSDFVEGQNGLEIMQVLGANSRLKNLLITPRFEWDEPMAEALAKSNSLEALNVGASKNIDSVLPTLARLPRMRKLACFDCGITDAGMAAIGNMAGIEALNLGNNSKITDEGYRNLAKLKKLRWLRSAGSNRMGYWIRELKSLEYLSVNRLPGSASVDIRELKNLRVLHAAGAFRESAILDFCALENLEELGFTAQISDEALACIPEKLKKLKRLTLASGNKVSNSTVELVAKLPNLERLWLFDSKLTAGGLRPLKGKRMKEIRALLSGLTGDDLAFVVENFPELEILEISPFPFSLRSTYSREQLLSIKRLKRLRDVTLPRDVLTPREETELQAYFAPGIVRFR